MNEYERRAGVPPPPPVVKVCRVCERPIDTLARAIESCPRCGASLTEPSVPIVEDAP